MPGASLKSLHAGCELGDPGACMLADALNATNALDTLELLSCGIGAAGVRGLARAVDESNFNLLQLNLRGALRGSLCADVTFKCAQLS